MSIDLKEVQTSQIKDLDFADKAIDEILGREDAEILDELIPSITELCKTGKSPVRRGDLNFFFHEGDIWFVKNGNCYQTHSSGILDIPVILQQIKSKTFDNNFVSILLLPSPVKSQGFFAVLNGDEDIGSDFVGEFAGTDLKYVTVSFECLRRFYGEKTTHSSVGEKLIKGELEIVDYSPDDRIALTAAEKKAFAAYDEKVVKARNQKKPLPKCTVTAPASGYTRIHEDWHRSATVVFYDKKKKFSILIGQDEGTYFGVELADNPKSVEAAYTSLIPKEIRKISGVTRQGEWFCVPVDPKEVPEVQDCLLEANTSNSGYFNLGRDGEDSARHDLTSEDIRVSRDGVIYALNPTITHENGDHADLAATGWNTFVKNTAVRAFSVQGVD